MKKLVAIFVMIPWLAFSNDESKWCELQEDEIEGVRKFEILFESPMHVEISSKTKGHTQSYKFPTPEVGYTLTIFAPEIRPIDANLTIRIMGHTTGKTYSESFFNEPTNLHDCKPELSTEFLLTVGKYTIILSPYLNRIGLPNSQSEPRAQGVEQAGADQPEKRSESIDSPD